MGLKHLLLGVVASAAVAGVAQAANIPNGNFENGFSGFTSTYTQVGDTSQALFPAGTYTIGSDPSVVNSNWIAEGGSNNLLLVNGSTNPDQSFVYTSDGISLGAGAYNLTAQVANVCCNASFTGGNAASTLTFSYSLDGSTFTSLNPSYTTTPQSTNSGLTFSNLSFAFLNSTDTNNFRVRITNGTDAASGNDFAIDNISLSEVSAAPEPGVWALMLAGVAFLGLALRARRREGGALSVA